MALNVKKMKYVVVCSRLHRNLRGQYVNIVLTIVCTVCCIYVMLVSTELNDIRKEITQLKKHCEKPSSGFDNIVRNFGNWNNNEQQLPRQRYIRQAPTSNNSHISVPIKRDIRKNKRRKGIESNKKSKKKRRKRTKCKKKKNCGTLLNGNFTSDFWEDVKEDRFIGDCVSLWDGTACRDRSFTSKKDNQDLITLKSRNVSSPIISQDGRRYRIRMTGLYLVYIHMTFWKSAYENESLVVLKHSVYKGDKPTTVLYCSADGTYHPDNPLNVVYNICTETKVLYMWQNDLLEIVIVHPDTKIDLSKQSSYFGIVKLQ